jgi:hypothetical protein
MEDTRHLRLFRTRAEEGEKDFGADFAGYLPKWEKSQVDLIGQLARQFDWKRLSKGLIRPAKRAE